MVAIAIHHARAHAAVIVIVLLCDGHTSYGNRNRQGKKPANQCAFAHRTAPIRYRVVSRVIACGAALALATGAARADSLVVCTEASPDALDANLSTANTS
jgi:hypothetical protein